MKPPRKGIAAQTVIAIFLTSLAAVAVSSIVSVGIVVTTLERRWAEDIQVAQAIVEVGWRNRGQMLEAQAANLARDPNLVLLAQAAKGSQLGQLTAALQRIGIDVVAITDAQGRVVAALGTTPGLPAGLGAACAEPRRALAGRGYEVVALDDGLAYKVVYPLPAAGGRALYLHAFVFLSNALAQELAGQGLFGLNAVMFFRREGFVAGSRPPSAAVSRVAREAYRLAGEGKQLGTQVVKAPEGAVGLAFIPLLSRSGPVGVMVVSFSRAELVNTLGYLLRSFALVALMALLLAFLVGRWRARAITGPVNRLRDNFARIAAGDWTAELPTSPEPRDEVEALGNYAAAMTAQLRRTFDELNSERQKLATLVESMHEAVLVVDPQGQVLFANPAARAVMAMGRNAAEAESGSVPEPLKPLVEKALNSGAHVESEIEISSDPLQIVRARAGRIASAEATAALVVLADVTHYKQLDRMKSDFIAYVAHELRNPLTVIKGFAQTILDGLAVSREKERELLRAISLHSDRLSRLVNGLLDATRIEGGAGVALREEPVDLVALLSGLLEAQRAYSGSHVWSAALPQGGLWVCGDRYRLELVFSTLLDNAAKHTPAGTRVTVEAYPAGKGISVVVRDEGPGIPPAHLPHIFDKFYRVPGGSGVSRKGTGLGLYLARNLVEAHGGSISADSQVGKGTAITVTLPGLGDEECGEKNDSQH